MDATKARGRASQLRAACDEMIKAGEHSSASLDALLVMRLVALDLTRFADDHDLAARTEGTRLVK